MGTKSRSRSPAGDVAMIHPSRRMLVKPVQPIQPATRRSPTPKRRSPSPKRRSPSPKKSPRRRSISPRRRPSASKSKARSRSRSRSVSPDTKPRGRESRSPSRNKKKNHSKSRSWSRSRDSVANGSSTYRSRKHHARSHSRSRSRSRTPVRSKVRNGSPTATKRDSRRSRSPVRADRGRTDTQTGASKGRFTANERRTGADANNRGFRGAERGGRFNSGRANARDNRDRRGGAAVGNKEAYRPPAADTTVVTKLKDLPEIDREKTCPLLLRLFCCVGEHHNLKEYAAGKVPADELMVHTWLNATFKELTMLIKGAIDEAKPKGTRMVFSAVYPTPSGQMVMKEIGELTTGRKGERDMAALGQTRFKIGDYLDVAIHPPAVRGRGGGSLYGRY
ncbi:hypothetical protein SARC_08810 [Sphaeroforma arctica JP610]|uniref:Histone deacetylase complex subunit SAP18 n=1 Tax=Sphaeroforma arctica JP610 TaxID=667725 RepID=A0A0L0FPX7_9EUKA|nr:hypothetical protein SARC_08810 [Sphaeroforma arctica JP610]KNC78769.1 hypothetical protein SARC_08810 [Sphaeroforma arctica JP610]|eukprot:XP_014152671.1 hypothetical protein SARC_08810 [Sphaeroforma arctica JP610]